MIWEQKWADNVPTFTSGLVAAESGWCGLSALTCGVFGDFLRVKDTGRIIHVRLWCVEIRVCAEQFRDQRQHQCWVTGTQELQAPEGEEENKKYNQSSDHPWTVSITTKHNTRFRVQFFFSNGFDALIFWQNYQFPNFFKQKVPFIKIFFMASPLFTIGDSQRCWCSLF